MTSHHQQAILIAPTAAAETMALQRPDNGSSNWQTVLISVLTCVAFWPLAPWYLARVMPASERFSAVLAFVTFCVFVIRDRSPAKREFSSLALPTVLLLLYAISYRFLPGLASATLAVLTIAAIISPKVYGVRIHPGICGLLLLSLPLLSRLQFFLGFPLRVAVGAMAAPLLQIAGLAVVREGAVLRSGTDLIVIDAPCSGIKMLWAAAYLTCILCCFYRLSPSRTVVAGLGAFILVLFGNVLRSTALFFFEVGAVESSPATHSGTGVVAFLGVGLGILWIVRRIGGEHPCVD